MTRKARGILAAAVVVVIGLVLMRLVLGVGVAVLIAAMVGAVVARITAGRLGPGARQPVPALTAPGTRVVTALASPVPSVS